MSKFKVGDRVVFVKRAPYSIGTAVIDVKGMRGVVIDVSSLSMSGYIVQLDGYENERPITAFESLEELEFEEVYDSPLYQALK